MRNLFQKTLDPQLIFYNIIEYNFQKTLAISGSSFVLLLQHDEPRGWNDTVLVLIKLT